MTTTPVGTRPGAPAPDPNAAITTTAMTDPAATVTPAATDPAALFSLSVERRAGLLVLELDDDPDYAAFEVQAFDDDQHGRGLLVLLQRRDRTVEVHHAPGVRVARDGFEVGEGLRAWRETPIEPAVFAIHPDGVEADVGFDLDDGRRVRVRVDDRDGAPRHRAELLAPVGDGVARPTRFFVVLMRGFDLVRTSGPEPVVEIGGVRRRITPFPGPAWLHRRRYVRYAAEPVIAVVNPALDGPVGPDDLGPVARLDAGPGTCLRFAPPVPDLRRLADGARVEGAWALDVGGFDDLTGGTWWAARSGDRVRVGMAVTRPWRPRGLPLSLRFVTTVAAVFRRWPTTYRWEAEVDLAVEPPRATSRWRRVAPGSVGGARADMSDARSDRVSSEPVRRSE